MPQSWSPGGGTLVRGDTGLNLLWTFAEKEATPFGEAVLLPIRRFHPMADGWCLNETGRRCPDGRFKRHKVSSFGDLNQNDHHPSGRGGKELFCYTGGGRASYRA